MTIALVSSQKAVGEAQASGSSIAVAFPGNTTTGNLVVVVTDFEGYTGSVTNVTDSQSNTYTLNNVQAAHSSSSQNVAGHFCASITGGTTPTVTATLNQSWQWRNIHISEYTHAGTGITLDKTASATGEGNNPQSGSQTPTTNGQLIIGLLDGADYSATDSPHTLLTLNNGGFSAASYYIQSTAASIQTDWTLASTQWWVAAMMTLKEGSVTYQYAYPTTDTTRDNWEEDDGTTTNIYDQIDEVTADDADYIRTQLAPSSDVYVTKLGNTTDPSTGDNHKVTIRYGKDSSSGDTISLVVQLRQGYSSEGSPGTLIATALNNTNISSGWTEATYTLSTSEANSITDYTSLYLRMVGNQEAVGYSATPPTYRGAGGTAAEAGSTSVDLDAVSSSAENDLLLCVVESSDSTTAAGTPNTPSGWTKIGEDTDGDGATNVCTLTIFARLAPSGGTSSVTVDGVGDHVAGRVFAVTAGTHGVTDVATDVKIGSFGKHGTSTSGLTTPSLTGLVANSLIFWCIGLSDDANDTSNASSYTNSNLASITERTDQTFLQGAGGGIAVATATCSGTSTGSGTWAHDTAVQSLSVYVAIPPARAPRRAQVSWARFQCPQVTATQESLSLGASLTVAQTPVATSVPALTMAYNAGYTISPAAVADVVNTFAASFAQASSGGVLMADTLTIAVALQQSVAQTAGLVDTLSLGIISDQSITLTASALGAISLPLSLNYTPAPTATSLVQRTEAITLGQTAGRVATVVDNLPFALQTDIASLAGLQLQGSLTLPATLGSAVDAQTIGQNALTLPVQVAITPAATVTASAAITLPANLAQLLGVLAVGQPTVDFTTQLTQQQATTLLQQGSLTFNLTVDFLSGSGSALYTESLVLGVTASAAPVAVVEAIGVISFPCAVGFAGSPIAGALGALSLPVVAQFSPSAVLTTESSVTLSVTLSQAQERIPVFDSGITLAAGLTIPVEAALSSMAELALLAGVGVTSEALAEAWETTTISVQLGEIESHPGMARRVVWTPPPATAPVLTEYGLTGVMASPAWTQLALDTRYVAIDYWDDSYAEGAWDSLDSIGANYVRRDPPQD